MEVDAGIQMLAVERIDRCGVFGADVAEADMLANHRAGPGIDQTVVAGTVRPRLGLFDQKFSSSFATVWLMNSLPLSE